MNDAITIRSTGYPDPSGLWPEGSYKNTWKRGLEGPVGRSI